MAKNLTKYDYEIGVEKTRNLYLKELKPGVNEFINNFDYTLNKVAKQDYDIFHPTYFYTEFLKYIGEKPFVFTIHDMIIEKSESGKDFSELSDDSKIQIIGKQILSQKCNKIITVSEWSKHDIIDILHVPADKIAVCYNGADQDFAKHADTSIINGINYEYILYVGTRAGTKNFWSLYEEFKNNIHIKYPNLHLVLVGPLYTQVEYDQICSDGLNEYICLYMGISEESLATLYKHAKCFIFPSIYEGFGIPIIESFMCECPILLNTTSCFPEIGQDAAIYFHLTDKQNDFSEVFDFFMSMSKTEIKTLTDKGLKYSKKYTWQNFAKSVEAVYDEILDKNKNRKNENV